MMIMNAMIIDHRYEKPVFFAYTKTKTKISTFVFATQIVQCHYLLNPKFQASCSLLWLYSPVQKPRIPVFSQRGSIIHISAINSSFEQYNLLLVILFISFLFAVYIKIFLFFNVPINSFSVMSGWSHCFLSIYQYFLELNAPCLKTLHSGCSNPGPLGLESYALPLSHRALHKVFVFLDTDTIIF